MIEITLTRGLVTLVDQADLHLVEGRSWSAVKRRNRWYASGSMGGRQIYMHRHLMGVTDPAVYVDHRNGDGLDNRRSTNLRLATIAQNAANSIAHGGASRYKGVFPTGRGDGRWRAQITAQGKRLSLGTFETEHDAAEAYNAAALQLHGDYARLNIIPLAAGQPS